MSITQLQNAQHGNKKNMTHRQQKSNLYKFKMTQISGQGPKDS